MVHLLTLHADEFVGEGVVEVAAVFEGVLDGVLAVVEGELDRLFQDRRDFQHPFHPPNRGG